MVDAAHEKETRARETIQALKQEITNLTKLVEQGAGLTMGQDNRLVILFVLLLYYVFYIEWSEKFNNDNYLKLARGQSKISTRRHKREFNFPYKEAT